MLGRREAPIVANGLVIREAHRRDLDQLMELWTEMMDYHRTFDDRFQFAHGHHRELERHFVDCMKAREARVYVADEDGRLKGYILGGIHRRKMIEPAGTYGFISYMSVSTDCRRQGIGRSLATTLIGWFKKEGVTSVELLTLEINPVSNAFWESLGFGQYLRLLRKDF